MCFHLTRFRISRRWFGLAPERGGGQVADAQEALPDLSWRRGVSWKHPFLALKPGMVGTSCRSGVDASISAGLLAKCGATAD
jgi:hypothetical protein